MKRLALLLLAVLSPQSFAQTNDPCTSKLAIGGGILTLFPSGKAYFSLDGLNLEGGGNTILAYTGSLPIMQIAAAGSGVDTLFSNGSIYYSPNGQNLGGGCVGSVCTVVAYSATTIPATKIVTVGRGVDAVIGNASGYFAYFSPDGLHLGGGGNSILIYSGSPAVQQLVPAGSGNSIVTLFSNGSASYSPDNRNIGGGGNTISAYTGSVRIVKMVRVGGGVLTQFQNGAVYLSPNGQNLGGGGATIAVANWVHPAPADGPFPARDSGEGAVFNSRLFLSGGFGSQTGQGCNPVCAYFDLWSSSVDESGNSWNSSATSAYMSDNQESQSPTPAGFWDAYSPLVVWNSALWAIGSSVWSSTDGATWSERSSSGPTTNIAAENTSAVVLGSYLYYIEQNIGVTPTTDVQRTNDINGSSWTDLFTIPGMEPRCGGVVFVAQSKIWIEGGRDALPNYCGRSTKYTNDIWSSSDGVTWTTMSKSPEWAPRQWPCVTTDSSGTVWLAGGYLADFTNSAGGIRFESNLADVWYTKDGSTWKQLKADAGSGLPDDGWFEPRHAPTCYIDAVNNRLVIVAGKETAFVAPPKTVHDSGNVSRNVRILQLPNPATLP